MLAEFFQCAVVEGEKNGTSVSSLKFNDGFDCISTDYIDMHTEDIVQLLKDTTFEFDKSIYSIYLKSDECLYNDPHGNCKCVYREVSIYILYYRQ